MAYKIAIIVGSLRKDSINRKVARSICGLKGDNLDCTMIEIGDLPLYNQDLDANPPDQWVRFRQQVGGADGVLFVSPEYNRGIPGVLKNAIDVGSRPYGQSVFDKKPAAIVTASPGSIGGFGRAESVERTVRRSSLREARNGEIPRPGWLPTSAASDAVRFGTSRRSRPRRGTWPPRRSGNIRGRGLSRRRDRRRRGPSRRQRSRTAGPP